MEMKFHSTDVGYCRVYWKHGLQLYCIQEEYTGVYDFLICSSDGEPCTPVPLGAKVFEPIPDPTEYEAGFNEYLRSQGALKGGANVL